MSKRIKSNVKAGGIMVPDRSPRIKTSVKAGGVMIPDRS